MTFRTLFSAVGEDLELHFALFSHEEKRYISDSYTLFMNVDGKMEQDMNPLKAVFKVNYPCNLLPA